MRSIYLFLKIETTCYEVEKVWISFDRKFSKELSKTSWMSKELFFSTFAIISYHLCPRRFFHRGNCWPLNWRTLISNLIEAIVYKSNFVIQQFSWKMMPPPRYHFVFSMKQCGMLQILFQPHRKFLVKSTSYLVILFLKTLFSRNLKKKKCEISVNSLRMYVQCLTFSHAILWKNYSSLITSFL